MDVKNLEVLFFLNEVSELKVKSTLSTIMKTFSLEDRKVLLAFKNKIKPMTTSDVSELTDLDHSAVVKSFLRLQKHGLIRVESRELTKVKITGEGRKYASTMLPEKSLLQKIIERGGREVLRNLKAEIDEGTLNICLGWMKKRNWVETKKVNDETVLKVTDKGFSAIEKVYPEEITLKILSAKTDWVQAPLGVRNEEEVVEILRKRNLVKVKKFIEETAYLTDLGKAVLEHEIPLKTVVTNLTPELILTGKWRDIELKKFDVIAPVKPAPIGKLHPTKKIIDEIREIWFDMGFTEAQGPLVELAFWCFDALYQPQDHPARELADTLYLKKPEAGKLPSADLIKRVKETHENGGGTGSTGWRYRWRTGEAEKLVLRTHTTSVSARFLTKIKPPAKIFSIGTVFRHENLDPTHLHEFIQVEGIVVSENVSFTDLLGYLKEYLSRLGFENARFRPGYFPYTELSVEPEVYIPERGEWIELGGAGIFRPEVVVPLLRKDIPVLAWGLGLDRLVMSKFNLEDIRYPYFNDYEWVKKTPII